MTNDVTSKALFAEITQDQPQLAKIEDYLAKAADTNYQLEEDGNTALMIAVKKRDEPIATFLLQQGANPFLKNHLQQTASDLAEPMTALYKLLINHEILRATQLEDCEKV
ncbi:MAG: ankyrin repeat domain-containing protein [Tatlockia sp.]|nr:ankyrin repeat domain-containing protein [Tatlockia sp.]